VHCEAPGVGDLCRYRHTDPNGASAVQNGGHRAQGGSLRDRGLMRSEITAVHMTAGIIMSAKAVEFRRCAAPGVGCRKVKPQVRFYANLIGAQSRRVGLSLIAPRPFDRKKSHELRHRPPRRFQATRGRPEEGVATNPRTTERRVPRPALPPASRGCALTEDNAKSRVPP